MRGGGGVDGAIHRKGGPGMETAVDEARLVLFGESAYAAALRVRAVEQQVSD